MLKLMTLLTTILVGGFASLSVADDAGVVVFEESDEMTAPQVKLPLVLELKAKVEVTSLIVTLDDIATCAGSSSFCDEAYGVELSPSPLAGKVKYLSRKTIKSVVSQEWPQANLSFKGADSVKLRTVATKIGSNEILKALNSEVEKNLGDRKKVRLVIDSIQVANNLKFIGSDYEIRFPALFSSKKPSLDYLIGKFSGSKVVKAEYHVINSASKMTQNFSFLARMRVEVKLPVAGRNMIRGSRLRSSDFSEEWVAVKRSASRLVANIKFRDGYKLKQNIRVGDPVKLSAIELPKSIERGQLLSLFIRKGNLNIKTKVKALSGGAVGEEINVISTKTGKRSRAKIVNSESARLL